ncbi:AAA family ATPase [uncultured Rothia sp.]|uniref:AAA family ATPase n=1 Tax=uncultured Rothia sp. TaxID=316088 RepID=UPI00288B9545|nr:AAA family ATPase [uncultured Rothia sp.]
MVVAKHVSRIRVDTGYAGKKYYSFFTKESKNHTRYDAQCAVVLGRNGAGKSTIARALQGKVDSRASIKFFDMNGVSLGYDYSNVRVFDEMYIIENFRAYNSGHLNPIILLGDYVKIVEEIDDLRNQILRIEESISQKNKKFLDDIWDTYTLGSSSELYAGMCREFIEAYINNLMYANRHAPVRYSRLRKSLLDGIFEGDRSSRDQSFYRFISLGFNQSIDKIERIAPGKANINDDNLRMLEEELLNILRQLYHLAYSEKFEGIYSRRQSYSYVDGKSPYTECYRIIMSILFIVDYSLYVDLFDRDILAQVTNLTKSEMSDLRSKKARLEKAEEELERKRREDSASQIVKSMNQWLRVILGEDVIKIYSDGAYGYKVTKNGIDISPSILSTGEQNILALCYFFVDISNGEKALTIADRNQIIVLDDPVSSFDYSNKYGVIQILDHVAGIVSEDTSRAKMIIMTHDPVTALEISKSINYRVGGNKIKCCEIVDGQIINNKKECISPVSFEDIDEYRNILEKMFIVATEEGKGIDSLSPNEVRRVWEAFLRFELGESKISNRNAMDRVACFYDDQSVEYNFLKSFISYVYINQDSHSGSQMLFENFNLIPILGRHEFEKHIRQIILFMRLVAPHHIPSRLASKLKDIATYRDPLNKIYKKEVLKQP